MANIEDVGRGERLARPKTGGTTHFSGSTGRVHGGVSGNIDTWSPRSPLADLAQSLQASPLGAGIKAGFETGMMGAAAGVDAVEATTDVGNSMLYNMQHPKLVGSADSPIAFIGDDLHLMATYNPIVPESIGHKGRPLCQPKTLNQLSGFCQCSDVTVDMIPGSTETERKIIAQYLVGGFFIE